MFRYYCLLHLCLFMQSIFARPRKRSLRDKAKRACLFDDGTVVFTATGGSTYYDGSADAARFF